MNEYYRRLAFELDDGNRGDFLSGWQCENRCVARLLAEVRARCASVDFTRYTYFDADEQLSQMIARFHQQVDRRAPEAILCGPGASPLLATFLAFLSSHKAQTAYYLPPVYHSILTGLERYGITVTAVAERQPYEADFRLLLPDRARSVLFMTDPAWYCGTAVSESTMIDIASWQRSTDSIVFVDGSFQYLPWSGTLLERTGSLEPSLTYRLVNPCKQLAIHGYRFAYLILPNNSVDEIAWTSTNLTGPASAESVAFAHEAMKAITEQEIPRSLIDLARSRYRTLLDENRIAVGPEPVCGYSVFCKIVRHLPADYVLMDGKYFQQPRYPGFAKVNLLSPSIGLLLD